MSEGNIKISKLSEIQSINPAKTFVPVVILSDDDSFTNNRMSVLNLTSEISELISTLKSSIVSEVTEQVTDDITGVDTETREYVYQCSNSPVTAQPNDDTLEVYWHNDLSEVLSNFNASNPYIYMCYRDKNGETYGSWSNVYLWTYYGGQSGKDGAGVEFIFGRTSTAQTFASNYWDNITNSDKSTDDEFIPQSSTDGTYTGVNSSGSNITITWQDDPALLNETYRYQYMAKRVKPSGGTWSSFSTPVIWSYYAKDGESAEGTETLIDLGSYWKYELDADDSTKGRLRLYIAYSNNKSNLSVYLGDINSNNEFINNYILNNSDIEFTETESGSYVSELIGFDKIPSEFIINDLTIVLYSSSANEDGTYSIIDTQKLSLSLPVGHYFSIDDDGTYNVYNSNEKFSSITQNLDTISATVSKLLPANLFTGLIDGTDWGFDNYKNSSEISSPGTINVIYNNPDVSDIESNPNKFFIKSPSISVDKGSEYTLSWYGLICSKILVYQNTTLLDTITITTDPLRVYSDSDRFTINYTPTVSSIKFIFIYNPTNSSPTTSLMQFTSIDGASTTYSNKIYSLNLIKPKLELGSSATDWTLSNTDAIQSANLTVEADKIALEVKKSSENVEDRLSKLEVTATDITAIVKEGDKIGGLTINSEGSTFTGKVSATDFIINSETYPGSSMEMIIWAPDNDGNYPFTWPDALKDNKPEDGTPVIISRIGSKLYVLNLTAINQLTENPTYWVLIKPTFSIYNFYTITAGSPGSMKSTYSVYLLDGTATNIFGCQEKQGINVISTKYYNASDISELKTYRRNNSYNLIIGDDTISHLLVANLLYDSEPKLNGISLTGDLCDYSEVFELDTDNSNNNLWIYSESGGSININNLSVNLFRRKKVESGHKSEYNSSILFVYNTNDENKNRVIYPDLDIFNETKTIYSSAKTKTDSSSFRASFQKILNRGTWKPAYFTQNLYDEYKKMLLFYNDNITYQEL